MKKVYLSLFCFMFMFSLVLAGCSSKKEATPTAEPVATAAPTAAPTVAPTVAPTPNPNDDPFTIRLSAWFIDDRTFMKEFKANVEKKYKEKYPNATIQWDVLLSATYSDKLKAELASDTASDVIFFQGQLGAFADAGYLTDLSDQPWAAQLHPGTKSFTFYKGKTYAASLGLVAGGVWYNKKIFSDLGLTAPKTWEEFIQVMDKIKAANIVPMGVGFKDLWTAQFFDQHMLQSILYGADEHYPKMLYDGTKKLTDPEVQSVMNRFQIMTNKGFFNKTALTTDWPQSADMFTSGKSAMIVQGAWMPGVAEDNFTKKGHARFDIGYFAIPDDKGYVNLALSPNESIGVNAKSKLPQQSKDLISVILSPEILGPYSIGNGSIPSIQGMQVTFPTSALNEMMAVVSTAKTSTQYTYYLSASADTSMGETVTKIVSGAKYKPADLQDAQDKLEKDKATIVLPAE